MAWLETGLGDYYRWEAGVNPFNRRPYHRAVCRYCGKKWSSTLP